MPLFFFSLLSFCRSIIFYLCESSYSLCSSCDKDLNFFSITFYRIILSSVCSSRNSSMAYSFSSWIDSSYFRQSKKIYFISGSRFWRFASNFFFISDVEEAGLPLVKILQILAWLLSLTVRSWCWLSSVIRLTIS